MLLNSTLDMTGEAGYPSTSEGWGLIRLDDVLSFPGSTNVLSFWDLRHSDGLSTGDTRTHHVDVMSGARPLKITLVWTDFPGTVGAADPVVNDLDLRVTAPAGRTFLGNNFDEGASVVGGTPDAQNNVEVVVIPSPKAGTWTVTVDAPRVVSVGRRPGQGYALVVTTARPEWLIPALHLVMG
jgi:hypothetical protein